MLGGVVPLATSTNSTKASEIYEALLDAFANVGPLNFSREAPAPAVQLRNGKTMIVGGSHCYATTINNKKTIAASPTGATESGNTVTITTTAAHGFIVGATVGISGVGVAGYNGTFTINTIPTTTTFTYTDPTSGLAASGGGSATQNPSPACGTSVFSGFQCDALNTAELYTPTSASAGTFTIAGANSGGTMTTARSGAAATLLSNGTVLVTGGSTGSSFLSLTAAPTGCGPPGQMSQNTAEIYDPVADTFTATTAIPGCPLGHQPPPIPPATCPTGVTCDCTANDLPGTCPVASTVPIAASPTGATESLNTVTITTTTPHGFSVGNTVIVNGVASTGYNGTFVIGTVPTTTSFTYTNTVAGLPASGGGAATSDIGFRVCGLVDSAALLLNDNTVLIAGGDYLQFLGQSSQQSFIFNPTGATWTPSATMSVPRELPGQVKLPSGDVLLTGGLTSAAAACVGTGTPPGSTPVDFTSNSSAEVYDPVAKTWTLTSGSSAMPGAAGGMSVPRIATIELFTSGTDSGLVMAAGGVDAETTDGAGTNTFGTCEPVTNIAQTTHNQSDLFDPTTTVFTPTGALNVDRAGYGVGILTLGSHAGDLVAFGGFCGTATPSLSSLVIGTTAAASCTTGTTATTDYYEFFAPSTGLWTVGTGATPTTPAAAPDSQLLP